MLKKKGLLNNFKSKIIKKTYIDYIYLSIRISYKKVAIVSKMLNMVYLTYKHIHLKFGPKNRAVKLHKAKNTINRDVLVNVHYIQCIGERANHVRFEPTHGSTNLILYRLTI